MKGCEKAGLRKEDKRRWGHEACLDDCHSIIQLRHSLLSCEEEASLGTLPLCLPFSSVRLGEGPSLKQLFQPGQHLPWCLCMTGMVEVST